MKAENPTRTYTNHLNKIKKNDRDKFWKLSIFVPLGFFSFKSSGKWGDVVLRSHSQDQALSSAITKPSVASTHSSLTGAILQALPNPMA